MRLVAQTKLGFYPAHPTAIERIAGLLRLDEPHEKKSPHILDPCAGEGKAIAQIRDSLRVPVANTYAVELDGGRADQCRKSLGPEGHMLAPASFFGTRISGNSFGLLYLNPPFDDELGGGGRMEVSFLKKADYLLVTGGVLVLVMPITTVENNEEFQKYLDANFEDAMIYKFPAGVRKFKEVVYIARRRKTQVMFDGSGFLFKLFYRRYTSWGRHDNGPTVDACMLEVGTEDRTWTVPNSFQPRDFVKNALTDQELVAAVEKSPLLEILKPPKPTPLKRPPLPLYSGHVALLLASGMLDGTVYPEGEPPHVVRGTARKVEYLADKTETENPQTGTVTQKEVYSQKIVLTVRTVGEDGLIQTFEDVEREPEAKPAKKR